MSEKGQLLPLGARHPVVGRVRRPPQPGPRAQQLIGVPDLDKCRLMAGLPPTTCALAAITSS